jgi:phosphoglycolate phosphatase-like HAD superfamily hydrolase
LSFDGETLARFPRLNSAFGSLDSKMKTILFDFDYTLADSSKGAFVCINYALSAMGESKRNWKECCDTIGLSLSAVGVGPRQVIDIANKMV